MEEKMRGDWKFATVYLVLVGLVSLTTWLGAYAYDRKVQEEILQEMRALARSDPCEVARANVRLRKTLEEFFTEETPKALPGPE